MADSVTKYARRVAAGSMSMVMTTTLALVASELPLAAEAAEIFQGPRGDLQVDEPASVSPVEVSPVAPPELPADQVWDPEALAEQALLSPGRASFDLDEGPSPTAAIDADDFAVSLSASRQHPMFEEPAGGQVTVEILDPDATRAAGVAGALVAVSGTGSGAVDLSLDYSPFARLYGGAWATRLAWRELPACAVTTPDRPGCTRPAPVPSINHVDSQVATAQVHLGGRVVTSDGGGEQPRVFALMSTAQDEGSGDYSATDLEPAGSWSAGGSDGAFTYSYPLRLPPGQGPVPQVSLGYSSASHDGRTSGSNNQASWVGDGWEYEPGFIERSYPSCARDQDGGNNDDPTGDRCWDGDGDSVTISLNGTNTTLVRDDDTGEWRTAADANWRVELLGSAASDGSGTSERWKVTTTDGAEYFFGAEPGESSSRLAMPVFGNHSGEPCHASDFADSWCDQAYRWLLDKVVDVHGNVTRYFHEVETGHYGAGGDPDERVAYDRAAVPERIEYGLRADDGSVEATGRVLFSTDDRCLDDCWDGSEPKTENWPDTPWDLDCDDAPCTSPASPTFFSASRLVEVTTQVRDGSSYRDVDSWALEHEFQDYGADEQVVMWLSSIRHTGHVGGEVTLPKVEFVGEALPNRVDAAPGVPVMWRWRMFAIKSETGSVTTISYRDPQCSASNLPAEEHDNDMRCYPVKWTPEFHHDPVDDWFHKHVVTDVVETDTTGGQVAVHTSYEYSTAGGGTDALWGFDDSEFVEDEHRTYGQWRGYPQVTTLVGDPSGVQEKVRSRFYRGMDGQPQPGGGTSSVQLTDAEGNTVTDHEALTGRAFERLTYKGSTVVAAETTDYWTRQTATRQMDHDGGDLHAWMTGAELERSRVRLNPTTWQRTEVHTQYDDHGRPVEVSDLGDVDDPADAYCERIEYADNTTDWILSAVARTETVSVDCDAGVSRPEDVVKDERTFYDGAETYGQPPSKGLPTRVQELDEWDGGPVYVTTAEREYDELGRVVEEADALQRSTETEYTPAGPGPVTQIATVNPLGHQEVVEVEPAWGNPVAAIEPNGRQVDVEYDPMGRTSAVWLEGLAPGTDPASLTFEYLVRDNEPSAVITQELNQVRDYVTSVELFDSLLRTRQTQSETAAGERLLAETIYDSRGRVEEERGPVYNDEPPAAELVTVGKGEAARRVEYVHDAAGRITDEIVFNRQSERWRTVTSYGGSSDGFMTAVQPPEGAPATATVENARGEAREKRTYRSNQPSGAYDSLAYDYTPTGKLAALTDEAGNTWSWEYDLRGREIASHDPDAGATSMVYDAASQLIEVTDARGETLSYEYDQLGRRTERRDGGGTLLAEWEYDTAVGGIGMVGSATRWHDGEAYVETIHGVNAGGYVSQRSVTLPESLGPLEGVHWFTEVHAVNGLVVGKGLPAIADLAQGGVAQTYDHVGNHVRSIFQDGGDPQVVVDDASYTPFGELQTRTLGASYGPRQGWHGFVYEEDTRRLERATFDRQASVHSVADVRYSYDPAGNVTSIADVPEGQPEEHELQCFGFDSQRRLAEAWAQGDTAECVGQPDVGDLGGPAPYWNSYEHDVTGNRTGETLLLPGEDPVQREYTYPGHGQPQPHALQQVDVTAGAGEAMQFNYDPAGNTTGRSVDGQSQTLTWDVEGNLAAVDGAGQNTEMIYTADGDRLVRDDGDTVTVFLPDTEVVWEPDTGELAGTRYFTHNGQVVAACEGGDDPADWTWFGVDHHGSTATHSVNAFTGVDHTRRMDPYGNSRGADPYTWPGQRGFVGGVHDPTGLVHIGARSYDPATGRFVTVDPVLDVGDDQQINGYTYASANPITYTDPTGLLYTGRMCVEYCGSDADLYLNPSSEAQQTGPVEPGAPGVSLNQTAGQLGWGPYDRLNDEDQTFVQQTTFHVNSPQAYEEYSPEPVGWAAGDYDIAAEVLGLADGHRCSQGDWAGCAWTAVAFTPLKPVKWGKLAIFGSRASRPATRSADDMPWHRAFCSFSEDTEVLMADGTTKPIGEIEPGDKVRATDPETDQEGPRLVLAVWVHNDILIDLETDSGTVTTTADHPFWNATSQTWQPAETLEPGDQLLTADGTTVTAAGLNHTTASLDTAYNLTINNIHTYHVVAGDTPVLVHNTNGCNAHKWTSQSELIQHFDRHGSNMGFQSPAEYRYAAEDLMCRCPGGRSGVLAKQDGDTTYFLDPQTGEFGVTSDRGIVTYFIPDSPMRYFDEQQGALIP